MWGHIKLTASLVFGVECLAVEDYSGAAPPSDAMAMSHSDNLGLTDPIDQKALQYPECLESHKAMQTTKANTSHATLWVESSQDQQRGESFDDFVTRVPLYQGSISQEPDTIAHGELIASLVPMTPVPFPIGEWRMSQTGSQPPASSLPSLHTSAVASTILGAPAIPSGSARRNPCPFIYFRSEYDSSERNESD